MKKIFFILFLAVIFLCLSCREKSESLNEPSPETLQEENPEISSTAENPEANQAEEILESLQEPVQGKVNSDIIPGWLPHDTLIVKERLKLRDSGSVNGNLVEVLDEGTEVIFLEIADKKDDLDRYSCPWVKVSHDGKVGWCFGAYLCNPRADEYFFNMLDNQQFGYGGCAQGYFSRRGNTLIVRQGFVDGDYFQDLPVAIIDGVFYMQRPDFYDESTEYLPFWFKPEDSLFTASCEYRYTLCSNFGAGKINDGDKFSVNGVTATKCSKTMEFLDSAYWYESPMDSEPYAENMVYWGKPEYRKIPNCRQGVKFMRPHAAAFCKYNGEVWYLIKSQTLSEKMLWFRASSVKEITDEQLEKEAKEWTEFKKRDYEGYLQARRDKEKKILDEMDKIGAVPFSKKDNERMDRARGYELLSVIAYELEW